MTKQQLEEYQDLKREIKLLEQKIKELENREVQYSNDVVKGSSKHFPYTQHPVRIYGIDLEVQERTFKSIERKKIRLRRVRMELEETGEQILEWVNGIDKSEIRQIFMLRYLYGYNWSKVAKEMNENDESYPRRKHNDFLKVAENTELDVL